MQRELEMMLLTDGELTLVECRALRERQEAAGRGDEEARVACVRVLLRVRIERLLRRLESGGYFGDPDAD